MIRCIAPSVVLGLFACSGGASEPLPPDDRDASATPQGRDGGTDGGRASTDGATEDAAAGEATCLPDGKVLEVTALGDKSYFIDGTADPTLTFCRGRTYTFRVSALHHPFYVKTTRAAGRGDAYASGVTNNGTDSGNVVFEVPPEAPALLHYICSAHEQMVGDLVIVDPR